MATAFSHALQRRRGALVHRLQCTGRSTSDVAVAVIITLDFPQGEIGGVATIGVAPTGGNTVVLGERLAVGAGEAIIGSPRIALVFHEEKQAASCVGEMGEPGL